MIRSIIPKAATVIAPASAHGFACIAVLVAFEICIESAWPFQKVHQSQLSNKWTMLDQDLLLPLNESRGPCLLPWSLTILRHNRLHNAPYLSSLLLWSQDIHLPRTMPETKAQRRNNRPNQMPCKCNRRRGLGIHPQSQFLPMCTVEENRTNLDLVGWSTQRVVVLALVALSRTVSRQEDQK